MAKVEFGELCQAFLDFIKNPDSPKLTTQFVSADPCVLPSKNASTRQKRTSSLSPEIGLVSLSKLPMTFRNLQCNRHVNARRYLRWDQTSRRNDSPPSSQSLHNSPHEVSWHATPFQGSTAPRRHSLPQTAEFHVRFIRSLPTRFFDPCFNNKYPRVPSQFDMRIALMSVRTESLHPRRQERVLD